MIRLHFRKDLLLDVWPGFFGVLALWWELSGAGEVAALAMLGAVLLHECGHLFCYWRTGIPVNRITFDFRGITIRPAQGIYPHKKQLATISGGCLFSIAGALAGWAASVWSASLIFGGRLPLPPLFIRSSRSPVPMAGK